MANVAEGVEQVSLTTSYWPDIVENVSSLPVAQPHNIKVECGICLDDLKIAGIHFDGFNSLRESRRADVPLVLPCGHIVGRRCFTFLKDSPRYGTEEEDWLPLYLSKTSAMLCPLCRYPLNHGGCGHWVMGIPAPIFKGENLDVVPRVHRPHSPVLASCSSCDANSVPWPATEPPNLLYGWYNTGQRPYWEAVDSDIPHDRSKGYPVEDPEEPEEANDGQREWERFVLELHEFGAW